jgi:hypothetical protein
MFLLAIWSGEPNPLAAIMLSGGRFLFAGNIFQKGCFSKRFACEKIACPAASRIFEII